MPILSIRGLGEEDIPAQFPDGMTAETIRDFLRKKYVEQAMSGDLKPLTPVQNTVEPYEPTLSEKIGTTIGDTLRDTGIISDNYGAQRIGKNVSALAEFLPGVGDATAGDDFGRAVKQGDKFGMAMAGIGAIPIAGDLAKKANKIRVTHGSLDPNFDGQIKKGGLGNIFDGVFASYGDKSNYGGKKFITYEIDEDKIMTSSDAEDRYDDVMEFISKTYPDADEDKMEQLYSIIAEDANVWDMDINPLEDYGYDDLGEASWEGQRKRGELARYLGFDAVDVDDEFGTSVLIPYGSNANISPKAIKPASQSLPMDEVSRMARAKEQGFDVDNTWYHGSSRDFDSFDMSKFGDNEDRGDYVGKAIYATKDPEVAERYAKRAAGSGGGENIMPVYLKMKNPLIIDKNFNMEKYTEDFPVSDKIKSTFKDKGLSNKQLRRFSYLKSSEKEKADYAMSKGYDGLIDETYPQGAVFDPSQVRSKFAEFNPNNIEKTGLLGGLGALALGANNSNQDDLD